LAALEWELQELRASNGTDGSSDEDSSSSSEGEGGGGAAAGGDGRAGGAKLGALQHNYVLREM
jgi:hypothetical protein